MWRNWCNSHAKNFTLLYKRTLKICNSHAEREYNHSILLVLILAIIQSFLWGGGGGKGDPSVPPPPPYAALLVASGIIILYKSKKTNLWVWSASDKNAAPLPPCLCTQPYSSDQSWAFRERIFYALYTMKWTIICDRIWEKGPFCAKRVFFFFLHLLKLPHSMASKDPGFPLGL